MTTRTASAKNQAVTPSAAPGRRVAASTPARSTSPGTTSPGSRSTAPSASAKAAANRNRGSDADSLGLFLRDLDHHPLPDHDAQTELAKRVASEAANVPRKLGPIVTSRSCRPIFPAAMALRPWPLD